VIVSLLYQEYSVKEIYILDLNNRDITNLTNSSDEYLNVIWSPDGSEIAYTKEFFEGYCHELGTDVFIINVNTGESRRLTYTVEDSVRVYTSVIDWR
jgi:Tol biopolymer transport system component